MAMIEFHNVEKYFEWRTGGAKNVKHWLIKPFKPKEFKPTLERRQILNGVSFKIEAGEFVGIMGRNGVGKSTLLKLLSGIYTPSSGSIEIHGRIAPVLELGAGFADELSGYENIFLNASIMGFSKQSVEEHLDKIIAFSELGDHIYHPVRNYSSGMLVRLAFSIACHMNADVLLFDEVFAVGDLGFQKKCSQKIRELHKLGKAIVLVTHSPDQVAESCDRCILLDESVIKFDGSAIEGAEAYKALFWRA